MSDGSQGPARLALEDGTVYQGRALGAPGTRDGEVVFNTAMTGYQEVLSDPSYAGQIVAMTYPLMGNYGVNPEDLESGGAHLRGFVAREVCRHPSSFRATADLDTFLREQGVCGIEGVDTRDLTLRLRDQGSLRGVITSETEATDEDLVARARACPGVMGLDLVQGVATRKPYTWTEGFLTPFAPRREDPPPRRFRVVAVDYGVKRNILRGLVEAGCDPVVVPPTEAADRILARAPDGVFLSNGPGDPQVLEYAIDEIRGLAGQVPVFGICLGHQLLALALGGRTYKLPFGHHGANHPVQDLRTGKIEITSQNHGFAVDPEGLPSDATVTHVNCNDGTVEGIRYGGRRAFSMQYHPEASPGPRDSLYLFRRFTALMTGEEV